jgi:hypothetical protein
MPLELLVCVVMDRQYPKQSILSEFFAYGLWLATSYLFIDYSGLAGLLRKRLILILNFCCCCCCCCCCGDDFAVLCYSISNCSTYNFLCKQSSYPPSHTRFFVHPVTSIMYLQLYHFGITPISAHKVSPPVSPLASKPPCAGALNKKSATPSPHRSRYMLLQLLTDRETFALWTICAFGANG